MAKRRMHHSGMWESEKFADLHPMARLLTVALIDIADDQGRFKAHPAWLRSRIFPYDDFALTEISEWLEAIANNETIVIYTAKGKTYGQLLNWWEYQKPQYAMASQWPAPEGWEDRIRVTHGGGKSRKILAYNWTDHNGNKLPNTCDHKGKPVKDTPEKKDSGTPIRNTYSNTYSEHLDDKDKDKDKNKDNDDDKEISAKNGHRGRRCFEFYHQNIGVLNPFDAQLIGEAVDEFGEDTVIEAMKVAVGANVRRWNYISRTLDNWKTEGRWQHDERKNKNKPKGKRKIIDPITGAQSEVLA
jgi:DnaD/phage-associated family protein